MDVSFMSRVKERLALATASGSWPSASTRESFPVLQSLPDVLATYSPAAEFRCVECKAPLVEGSSELCIACGSLLTGGRVVKGEQFSLQKSLALRLFYEANKLDIPEESLDIKSQQLEAPISAIETEAKGEDLHYAPSGTDFGFEDFELSSEEVFGPWQETTVNSAGISRPTDVLLPSHLQDFSEVEEEYIWASAETDNLGSMSWPHQFANSNSDLISTGDFISTDFMPPYNSTFYSGRQPPAQNQLIDFDFFQAPPQINHQVTNPRNTYSDLLNLGELNWSSPQAEAFSNSTPVQHLSSTNDFFRQLEGLVAMGYPEGVGRVAISKEESRKNSRVC